MSTSGPTLHKFAVWAPDMTDPEAFSRRMAVRETHLANAKKSFASGTLSTYQRRPSCAYVRCLRW